MTGVSAAARARDFASWSGIATGLPHTDRGYERSATNLARRAKPCYARPWRVGTLSQVVRDRGSATIWVLTCSTLVLLLALAVAIRAAAALARHEAETAADLLLLPPPAELAMSATPLGSARQLRQSSRRTAGCCWRARQRSSRVDWLELSRCARRSLPGYRSSVMCERALGLVPRGSRPARSGMKRSRDRPSGRRQQGAARLGTGPPTDVRLTRGAGLGPVCPVGRPRVGCHVGP
jgi:hypothetical protein